MMRHAGVGFPNGPVVLGHIFALPAPDLLMLVTEARWHHDEAVRAGKRVLWRAIPNRGKRPAEVGWSPARAVDEALNLTDTATEPIRDFVPWNELDLQDERGDHADDFAGLEQRYALLGGFLFSALTLLRQRLPGTRLHSPAFTPDHDALLYVDRWRAAADLADVIDFHAYDYLDDQPDKPGIRSHYLAYRAAFPGKRLALTEWHGKGDAEEERRILTWLADTMEADPLFDAAYRFIWRWDGAPGWWSPRYDVESNPEMVALFMDPPVAARPADPPAPEPEPPPAPPEPIQEPAMPTSDPWEHFSAEQIATASGCPLDAVTEHWPQIVRQLALCGIADRPVQVAAIGTVAIETASTFRPIHEYGTEADWADYEGGPEYAGRGFIQLTHLSNYRTFGEYVDDLWHAGGAIDLVARPDDALDPNVAAAVLATYFVHHTTLQGYSIPDAARAGDWEWVRRLVQGGTAGLDRLVRIASALEGAPMPTKVAFDANEPAHAQEESFDCSQEALEWALFAVGRRPSDDWLENTMIDEGVMSAEQGLLDATGKGLADFVTRQYGEFGFYANNEPSVTFDAVANEIGPYPLLIGGRRWSHWSGVRGYDAIRDILLLANPADGWQGVKQTMNRAQFDALGPFSMVRVLHPDLVPAAEPAPPAPEPAPAPPRAPEQGAPAMTLADVRARLLAIQDEITALLANLPAA
jgi:hypothetical protein